MEKKLVITDSNYEGYSKLFNAREKVYHKKRIKSLKIYTGVFCLSAGIGIAIATNTNAQVGLASSLFIGGWGTIIRQKIEDFRDDAFKLDDDTLKGFREKYPNMDPDVNQDLLYLALDEQGMLKRYKGSHVYSVAENFKEKKDESPILCKECLK